MMLREESAEVSGLVDLVYGMTENLSRGDVLLWSAIEEATGLVRHCGRWTLVMKKVKRRLVKERKIHSCADYNVGLRLLTHSEQVSDYAPKMRRFACRKINRAISACCDANPAELSAHEQRLRMIQIANLKETKRTIISGARAAKKTKTNPRRVTLLAQQRVASAIEQARLG